jgi:hypothetical protein
MGVHLTAEGLQVKGFLGCHRNLEYTVIGEIAVRLANHGPGQSHFKLRDDFVLKGHGFSRAEERS